MNPAVREGGLGSGGAPAPVRNRPRALGAAGHASRRQPDWSRALRFGFIALAALPLDLAGQGDRGPWWSALDTLSRGVHLITLDSLYTVRGTTAREIALQLAELGPRRDGRSFHGFHEAPWRWSYRTEGLSNGRCRLVEFKLVARSVITLPHLAGDPPVPRDLRDAWDSYLANLRAHEEGHRAIALRILRRFERRAAAIRPLQCDRFQGLFESMTEEAEEELRSSQATYDRETDFGRTQGAVWPPVFEIVATSTTPAGR